MLAHHPIVRMYARPVERAAAQIASQSASLITPSSFPDDPVRYAHEILRVKYLWDKQAEALMALLKDPYRVMMPSATNTGKTMLAAIAINWWYDSFPDGVSISTAPSQKHVEQVLWAQVRSLRQSAGLPGLMPAAPMIRSGPNHYAVGMTAIDGTNFRGRHPSKMLIVFDEANGIDPVFWEAVATMFHRRPGFAFLAIFNPTDSACQAYLEDSAVDSDGNPKWQRFSLDALDHPNVKGRNKWDAPVIPNAVSWQQVDENVSAWCDPCPASDANPEEDLEWPEGSGRWWKQGPMFLANVRGKWPIGQAFGVWSDLNWSNAVNAVAPIPTDKVPEIGVDVARFGTCFSAVHVRWGHGSVYHDHKNGYDGVQIANWVKEIAEKWIGEYNKRIDPNQKKLTWKEVPVKFDPDGNPGAIDHYRHLGGMGISVGASTRSISGNYPNKRSELWFQTADRATGGHVCLGRLPSAVTSRMRAQAITVKYRLNAAGMRVVDAKEVMIDETGRSPDDMDALNLAYMEGWEFETAKFIQGNQRAVVPLDKAEEQEVEAAKQVGGKIVERPPQKRRIW